MGRNSKDRNEVEHLRGIIRELKAELKHLKKQLARGEKEYKKIEALTSSFSTADEPLDFTRPAEQAKPICVKCHKNVIVIDLGTRVVYSCINEQCKNRQVVRSHGIKKQD